MKNIADRFKYLREKELGKNRTKRKFARKLGVSPNTYLPYEKKVSSLSKDILTKLHDIYGVNLNWLVTGTGSPYMEPEVMTEIPLVGSVVHAGLKGGKPIDRDVIGHIHNPHRLKGDKLMAFQVLGHSMTPMIRPGQLVIVNPDLEPHPGATVIYKDKSSTRGSVKIFTNENDGKYYLWSCNPDDGQYIEIKSNWLEFIYSVVEIR